MQNYNTIERNFELVSADLAPDHRSLFVKYEAVYNAKREVLEVSVTGCYLDQDMNVSVPGNLLSNDLIYNVEQAANNNAGYEVEHLSDDELILGGHSEAYDFFLSQLLTIKRWVRSCDNIEQKGVCHEMAVLILNRVRKSPELSVDERDKLIFKYRHVCEGLSDLILA